MKPHAPIRIFSIVIITLLTIGLGAYWAPRMGELLSLKVVNWSVLPEKEETSTSLFREQSLLEKQYESSLINDITETLEKITGKGTVHAIVRAPLDFIQETTYPASDAQISAVGTEVRRLSVTVLLDDDKISNKMGRTVYQPHSKQDIKKYTGLVKSLVGFDAERGDSVEVQNMPFAPEKGKIFGIPRPVWANGIAFLLFTGLIIGIIFGFLFPIMRLMIREMREKLPTHRYPLIKKVILLCQKYPEQSLSVLRGWLNALPVRKNSRSYTFAEKAAILVLALGPTLGRKILKDLPDSEAKNLAKIISRLGRLAPEDIQEALTRFMRDFYAPSYLKGSPKEAQEILQSTKPNGAELYAEIYPKKDKADLTAWQDICNLSDDKIKTLLRYIDKDVMAFALATEGIAARTVFARNIPLSIWQELEKHFADIKEEDSLRARQIIVQTAQELHLFG